MPNVWTLRLSFLEKRTPYDMRQIHKSSALQAMQVDRPHTTSNPGKDS